MGRKWRVNLNSSQEKSLVVKGSIPGPRGYELVTTNNVSFLVQFVMQEYGHPNFCPCTILLGCG
jgi:hypothetical protein